MGGSLCWKGILAMEVGRWGCRHVTEQVWRAAPGQALEQGPPPHNPALEVLGQNVEHILLSRPSNETADLISRGRSSKLNQPSRA